MFDVKEYLRDWNEKIVCLYMTDDSFPKWKQDRELYLYRGQLEGLNSREILPNELVIEFDVKKPTNQKYIIQKHTEFWIDKIKQLFLDSGKGFHITSHGGVSQHFRTIIKGLEEYPDVVRGKYKLNSAKFILQQIGFKSTLVKLDTSLLNSSKKLIPLENAPHWKRKYNGNIEEVIFYSKKAYSRVVPEQIHFLNNTSPTTLAQAPSFFSSRMEFDRLQTIFNAMYRQGRRHFVVASIARLLKKHNIPKDEARRILEALLNNTPEETQENNRDIISFLCAYDNGNAPGGMLKLAFPNQWRKAYDDLESCFEVDL